MAAPPVAVETIGSGYNGHWMHVFQGANTQWLSGFEGRIICGNFFIGLQGQSAHIYDANIPRGAEIISATQRVQAFATSPFNTVNVPMNTPDRITYGNEPLLKPFELFLGWRLDQWSNWDFHIKSDVGITGAETSGGVNNIGWIMKQLTAPGATIPNRAKIGQRFSTFVTYTLGSCDAQMFRVGSPGGNGRMLIQEAETVNGQLRPNGVTIATSDDVSMNSIPISPTTGSTITFDFIGANEIDIVAGTQYFMIFEVDYSVLLNNYISVRTQNQFLTTGLAMHYGEGLGLDWQNFPGTIDCNQACQLNPLSTSIFWNLPRFVANQFYTSPDISQLVQDQVNAPWYEPDSGIIISQNSPAAGGNSRIWRSAQSVNMPQLTVTYRPLRVMVT